MSSLPEVQRLFFESLHGEPDPALLNAVLPSRRLGAADRIEIYRGMYFWRLRDALSEDFSKLAAVLGEERIYNAVYSSYSAHVTGMERTFYASFRDQINGALRYFIVDDIVDSHVGAFVRKR